MLIRNAELRPGERADVRIDAASIAEVAPRLASRPGETVLDGAGRALSVGLHDHHLHLAAFAVALESVRCGPPQVDSAAALARALRAAARRPPARSGWLRGIGYHESVAGPIDRDWLDRVVPDVPVRIQHRSGRLWIFNSRGLATLRADDAATVFERSHGRLTGRLYDGDEWLRERLGGELPRLDRASAALARFGFTGLTDASPRNGRQVLLHFAAERARGALLQDVVLMGGPELDAIDALPGVRPGPTKLYLHDAALPDFAAFCAQIRHSRRAGRPVAVHCVTRAELIFAAAALQDCGPHAGDRIEHAAVAPPEALELLAAQGLTVVTQPNFVAERGDAYLVDVERDDRPWLYRGRAFLDAGIALAAGSDAPYGEPDPWRAMAAAVSRRTRAGQVLGPDEALSPDEALALFCGDPLAPGRRRRIEPGAAADVCLLDRSWAQAFEDLAAVQVETTIRGGRTIWQR